MLLLYGYYKQATVGNNETPKPSIFHSLKRLNGMLGINKLDK